MLVAGGWSGHNIRTAEVNSEAAKLSCVENQLQVFNPATGRWRVVGDLSSPRRGLTLEVISSLSSLTIQHGVS